MSNHTPEFEDEDDFRDWLEQQFSDDGWDTDHEVYPTSSKVRADLIVRNEEYGSIGIECKYMRSGPNGKKVGEALEQIVQKYRGKTYNGHTVDLWAFAPYFPEGVSTCTQTIRELLCHFGIGVIWTHKSQLKVDFAYSNSDTKILIKDFCDNVDKNRYGDIDKIEGSVLGKIGKLDSDNTPECQYDGRLGCTADSYETVEINSYEIRLCKRHIDKLDLERAADQKEHLH
jgi:hypothetical protein